MPEPTPFQKLQEITRRVLSVPKAEIDRRDEEWRKQRGKDPKKPQTPKKKAA